MSDRLSCQDGAITATRLTVFCEVAERRGFGRAADALFLTPPSVTAHVQALEKAWDVVLIDRGQHGAVLTGAGEIAYETSVLILNELTALRRRLIQSAGGQRRVIASTAFPAGFVLPGAIARRSQRDPDVCVSVRVTSPEDVAEAVRRGEVDAGVMSTATHPHGLATSEIWREPMVIVADPWHPLAQCDVLGIEDLAGHPFVVGPEPTAADAYLDRELMRATGMPRTVAMETGAGNIHGMRQAVAAGAGLALSYRSAIEADVENGDLVELNVVDAPPDEVFVLVERERGDREFVTSLIDAIQFCRC